VAQSVDPDFKHQYHKKKEYVITEWDTTTHLGPLDEATSPSVYCHGVTKGNSPEANHMGKLNFFFFLLAFKKKKLFYNHIILVLRVHCDIYKMKLDLELSSSKNVC
jgi:hypothetical protein